VAEDKEARDEMVKISNQRSVPVIVIDDQIIVGFDQQKIDEALSKS
jgi:glutaredoxin